MIGLLAPSPPSVRLRVLSLGAGVQSTTVALMAAHGEIGPMPDCAVFADTGWEPAAVYAHLAWLRSSNVLPCPVHVVSGGDIRADLLRAGVGARWASSPAFTRTVRGVRVEIGMIRRQCTKDCKAAKRPCCAHEVILRSKSISRRGEIPTCLRLKPGE